MDIVSGNDNGYVDYDSLAPIVFKFRQKGQEYTLQEPSEDALIAVESTKLRNAKLQDGKLTADIYKPLEAQIMLLSYCIVDAAGKTVPGAVLRSWGTRVIRDLHDRVEQMGQFGKKETAEVIEARIAADQKKLEMVKAGETHEGNS